MKRTVQIDSNTVEIEERGVKLRLTVVDTPGFGDAIDNTDSFKEIIKYIDLQFDRCRLITKVVIHSLDEQHKLSSCHLPRYLRDESGLNRKNIVDNRGKESELQPSLLHCFFFL